MFVKFSCGCIGTQPDLEGSSWVIKPCDEDDPDHCIWPSTHHVTWFKRDVSDKSCTPLENIDERDMHWVISKQLAEGDRMRELRQIVTREAEFLGDGK